MIAILPLHSLSLIIIKSNNNNNHRVLVLEWFWCTLPFTPLLFLSSFISNTHSNQKRKGWERRIEIKHTTCLGEYSVFCYYLPTYLPTWSKQPNTHTLLTHSTTDSICFFSAGENTNQNSHSASVLHSRCTALPGTLPTNKAICISKPPPPSLPACLPVCSIGNGSH